MIVWRASSRPPEKHMMQQNTRNGSSLDNSDHDQPQAWLHSQWVQGHLLKLENQDHKKSEGGC
eukprot:1913731-Prorocentrum_lima.AAC.1